jgi:hypothetical protein
VEARAKQWNLRTSVVQFHAAMVDVVTFVEADFLKLLTTG